MNILIILIHSRVFINDVIDQRVMSYQNFSQPEKVSSVSALSRGLSQNLTSDAYGYNPTAQFYPPVLRLIGTVLEDESFGKVEPLRVCELGCGDGVQSAFSALALQKKKIPIEVYTFDCRPEALEKTRESFRELEVSDKLVFTGQDYIRELPEFPEGFFDIIFSISALHYDALRSHDNFHGVIPERSWAVNWVDFVHTSILPRLRDTGIYLHASKTDKASWPAERQLERELFSPGGHRFQEPTDNIDTLAQILPYTHLNESLNGSGQIFSSTDGDITRYYPSAEQWNMLAKLAGAKVTNSYQWEQQDYDRPGKVEDFNVLWLKNMKNENTGV